MDRKIEKKYWTPNRILLLAGVFTVLSLSIYAFGFMDMRSSIKIDLERATVSVVEEDFFQETLPVSGIIQPIKTTVLDAIEGGVVQQVYLESGASVEKGDTILILANSTLQLQVMQQSSALYDQINNVRNSRSNLEQTSLRLKEQLADAKSQMEILAPKFERQQHLFNSDLISQQEFHETKKNFEYQKHRYELTYESFLKDSLQSITQFIQMDESEERMYENLHAVQKILDNLIVTAPITGQLSTADLNLGQSIQPGERIGQVDILDQYKVRVNIDEYHLPQIIPGLTGSYNIGETTYKLIITKLYPAVSNGTFQIDMEFEGETPLNLRRGQTLRIRLELSDSVYATQLKRGGFFQNTGGSWVYVLNEDEGKAYKRAIKMGRNNSEYFEIISGILPGEKVITSSYDAFGNNDVLIFK